MTIPALPDAPALGDSPEVFNTKAFAFVAALDDWGTAANALAVDVNADAASADTDAATATTQAGIATTGANTATTQAGIATTKAGEAATSANLADASADAANLSAIAAAASAASIDPDSLVYDTGDQTIAGVKTFSSKAVIEGLTVGKGAGSVATNTAVGASALAANTTGNENVAVGYLAMAANTTGADNVGIGRAAFNANTTGNNTVAVGVNAMVNNTIGSNNVAVGMQALNANTTASNNTAVGYAAGYSNTTGAYNSFFGYGAGNANTTGTQNTYIGENAGSQMTTGSYNTIIGAYQGNAGGLDIRTSSNYIVLSDGAGNPWMWRTAGYQWIINSTQTAVELAFAISGSSKASIYWDNTAARLYTYTNTNGPYVANGGTSWTNSSDERMKNITGEIQNGLSKVCLLRAAEYTWKADESAKPQVGLIAQDVLAVLPEAVEAPEEGTLDKDGNPAMMGVQYTNVIPLLVAAIKELKAEIDILKGQA